jgi:hypothetical protein
MHDSHKKRVKFKKFKKSQNFEKIMIFFKVYPLCTPFTLYALFCKTKLNYTYFYSSMLVKALKSTLPLFKPYFVKTVKSMLLFKKIKSLEKKRVKKG